MCGSVWCTGMACGVCVCVEDVEGTHGCPEMMHKRCIKKVYIRII